jgi:polysaccharide biosynthesis protein PslG
MRRLLFLAAAALVALALAAPASAAPTVRYGIMDDAWLEGGPGTLESRLDILRRLGVDIVRYKVRWDRVAPRRPARPRVHTDPAYRWQQTDQVLRGLRARGIPVVVTIYGTPRWANGNRAPNWAPTNGRLFGDFAFATARRYPWVRHWTVWNEPNQRRWLRPTTPAVYVQRLLNPGYGQLKQANRRNLVAGGVTAPRGNVGGMSPVAWIRGMRAARARLDAYAHNPYASHPRRETPWTGGCNHCATITMATLEKLLREVRVNFGASKRIWITEYAYQSNPPNSGPLGIPPALQARYLASGARRAHAAARVDMLIHFLVRDEPRSEGWQSGLFTIQGTAKPAYRSFMLPLDQVSRRGNQTVLWGQIRPRSGRQPYRLRVHVGGRWRWLGNNRWTNARGFYRVTVTAPRGARVQVWSPRDRTYSPAFAVR